MNIDRSSTPIFRILAGVLFESEETLLRQDPGYRQMPECAAAEAAAESPALESDGFFFEDPFLDRYRRRCCMGQCLSANPRPYVLMWDGDGRGCA